MRGLVLAGGRGTRLRPITHTLTKQLIPLANKPIIFYALDALADAGIREIGIIVGRYHPDYPGSIDTRPEIEQAVGDGSALGLRITYIEQDAPRGIAHAVKIARDFVGGEPFVTFLGDNFVPAGIKSFVEEFERERPNALILLCKVPNPQDFGVAVLENGRAVRLEEKPKHPPSDLALVGVYLFDSTIFEAIEHIRPSARGELEITHAIQWLIDNGLVVHPHLVRGWWKDTGTVQDLLEANAMVLDDIETRIEGTVDDKSQLLGKVIVEAGAEVIASIIQGPAIIGRGAKVINSLIGPYVSIYFDAQVERTEIANSIVLEESVLSRVPGKIRNSLIGKRVVIAAVDREQPWQEYMVGDYSRITF
jgi:glucose-1-phosphate thymidylyltransferase